MLDGVMGSAFARVALANVSRVYPHKLDHLLTTGAEPWASDHVRLHPAFFGSYDWHSAVHMHWLMVRVLRLHPSLPEADAIEQLFEMRFTPLVMEGEHRYLQGPAGRTFERPYGWAWLLELRAELQRLAASDARGARWAAAVDPLARDLAVRLTAFVATAPYPIRSGTHANTAFAALLAHDYATVCGDDSLGSAIAAAVGRWHADDRDAAVAYEPSLTDFLSPILAAAAAMRLVLPSAAYAAWFDAYLPDGLGPLASPPQVADRADPQIAHLDGLSLSRAWMLGRIATALPEGHARRGEIDEAASRHLQAGLPWTVGGDYAGEHWLASFAALALGDLP